MTLYAHRFGRTMHLLERGPDDAGAQAARRAMTGRCRDPLVADGRSAVFVASEKMTDEPWQPIEDGMLLRIDRTPVPHWRLIAA